MNQIYFRILFHLLELKLSSPPFYKSFVMLNSTEHEMSTAYKNNNVKKQRLFFFRSHRFSIYTANKC